MTHPESGAALTAGPLPVPPHLRRLADSMSILAWTRDADGLCHYLDLGTRSMSDTPADLDAEAWTRLVHEDDRARVAAALKAAILAEQPYQIEYRLLRSDGTLRWMLSAATPCFDAHGRFAGLNGTTIDVTERHDALEQLARSETAYRLLTEHASDLISHHAPDGTYLYVSPSVWRIQGAEPAQLLGRNVADYVHPDDAEPLRDAVRQMAQGGGDQLLEMRLRHHDGHYVWVGAKMQGIVHPSTGQVAGYVAISRDITAQRDMREALRRREEQFRSLTTLSSDWYWETDDQNRFSFVSAGLRTTLGVDPEKLLGMTRRELVIDPAQPGYLAYLDSTRRRVPFRGLQFATRMPGSTAIHHARVAGEPVFEDGAFAGYRGVVTDITADIEKAEDLARLADENRAVIEHSPDLYLVLDAHGYVVHANRAALQITGYMPEELIGKKYTVFVAPDDIPAAQANLDALAHDESAVQDVENSWVCKDGSLANMLWAMRWSEDRHQMYCTGRDITERMRARRALQRSNDNMNAVLESIRDAFFSVDRGWHITYANQVVADFSGRKRDKLIGRTLWSAIPDMLNSSFLTYFRQAMESAAPASFETWYEPNHAWLDVRVYPHEDGLSVFFHDITERRLASNALWLSEQRFRQVVEMNPAGYFLTNADGVFVEVNSALSKLCGYDHDQLLRMSLADLFPPSQFDLGAGAADGPSALHGSESAIRHRNGHLVYVLVNANIERDGEENVLAVTAFLTDISGRKRAELDLKKLATHDQLTGLPNRTFLEEQLPSILYYAPRGQANAVLLLDLDGFKQVNDTLGHAAGDALLCEIAQRLRRNTRAGDVVARLGGDEFVVIAPCPARDAATSAAAAASIAQQLIAALSEPIGLEGKQVVVGASIGISLSPRDGATREELFQHADEAMYRAKAAGRNCYRFYAAEPDGDA